MAKIFICGDILNKFCEDQFIDPSLRTIISSCDYAIGNLEGTVSKDRSFTGVKQHPSTLQNLKKTGFDLLLLANNHITDFGKEGLHYTINLLEDINLDYIGAGFSYEQVYAPKMIEVAGSRIGLINVCEAQVGHYVSDKQEFGYAWLGDFNLETRICKTKSECDYLIVLVHAGLEHYELPLQQYRELYQHYCDMGADCVIGSHPHISQGIENYKGKQIVYSLGNFYFPRSNSAGLEDPENKSFSVILDLEDSKIKITPVFHKMEKLVVSLCEEVSDKERLDKLSKILLSDDYLGKVLEQNEKAYTKVVDTLFRLSLNATSPKDRFLTKIHNIWNYLLYKDNPQKSVQRDKILLRLTENETYRYLITSVLKNRIK